MMNPTLAVLKQQFQTGALSKPDFIHAALQRHKTLFEYVDITRSTDVKEIVIAADGVSFVLGEERIRLYCPDNEARVAPIEVMNFNHYEPVETQVMDLLAANARTILDVGANIGLYAIRFAKRLAQAHIYAFEPMPTSYAFLQRNVAANQVGSQISCFNYGLSDSSGTVNFYISPAASTNASLLNVADAQDAQQVVGLTLTLDQWTANQKVAPDFIKCDVEGAELLVFRGGCSTLTQYQPMVFAELLRKWSKPFGYHPNDMLSFFADLDYQCFAVGDTGIHRITEVTDHTRETNYAFLHSHKHADIIQNLMTLCCD
ncbi:MULTISPECIES: FkbM family methyltransferase [Giesbergeria]|uniref:FkbM family methyltransferase n=1 Tax=Giesbergeria sinuosa TaxID=80883 RepID=A0ABV9Q9A6_9BURK